MENFIYQVNSKNRSVLLRIELDRHSPKNWSAWYFDYTAHTSGHCLDRVEG